MHITNQPVDITLANFLLRVVAHQHPPVLEGFDVLAGDANVYDVEVHPARLAGNVAGFADGANRFLDVVDDAPHDAVGLDLSRAQDLEPAVLIAFADQGADLRGADV